MVKTDEQVLAQEAQAPSADAKEQAPKEAVETQSLVMTLAYTGKEYSGFAKQKDESISTIQGELERALKTYFRRPVDTVCAGRTDAGVHAYGQVVSCKITEEEADLIQPQSLLNSLNALTPPDIVVKNLRFEPLDFSARFDAKRREYIYRIVTGPIAPLFIAPYAWWHKGELDIEAMKEAAQYLVGEHDFKSFCKTQSAEGRSTVRAIESIEIFEDWQLEETCLVIKVVGNAFLHSMVRTIVGTLVQVGVGNREPEWVAQVLEARDRNAAGETAPACGLTFWKVEY